MKSRTRKAKRWRMWPIVLLAIVIVTVGSNPMDTVIELLGQRAEE